MNTEKLNISIADQTPILTQQKRGRGRPKKVTPSLDNSKTVITPPINPSINKTNLEQAAALLRDSGALFDTLDPNVYKERLDNFTMNELNNEAFRVGLGGGADRANCSRAILEIFNDYRRKFVLDYQNVASNDNLSPENRKRALDLMRDGK